MQNRKRLKEHQKNKKIEKLFPELEKILGAAEKKILERVKEPKKKIFFIVGCARSGTTLVYQYLAKSGIFAYPSNVVSRFYYAPYIGARIQQLLFEGDVKGEIIGEKPSITYESELGKTKGATAPHEFWYFWNRFYAFGKQQQLPDKILNNVDSSTFLKELGALQDAFGKPLVMKALNMNWHIPHLASLSSKIFFIHVTRKTEFNAQSLLIARKKYFGNYDAWYSFKPHDYREISRMSNERQVVRQVISTNGAIKEGLKKVKAGRQICIPYEEFCKNPYQFLSGIADKSWLSGMNKDARSLNYKNRNTVKLNAGMWQAIKDEVSRVP